MNPSQPPLLSKSRFLAGRQCHLRLWYQCHEPQLAPEISPAKQALFNTGHAVGRLATRLYPQGLLIAEDHLQHEAAVASTRAVMEDPSVRAVYEAAFLYDGVRIRVDILERRGERQWNLVEVKSSTSAKEFHRLDAAVQYYVLRGAGLDIARSGILHLNNQYIFDGNRLDLESLFRFSDLSADVVALQVEIQVALNGLKQMLVQATPPAIRPSRHCKKPYECEFWNHCTKDMPRYWIFGLSGIAQHQLDELDEQGVEDIRHIPATFDLSRIQDRIRTCVIRQQEYIATELETELNDVVLPVHFLDFETTGSAIPLYPATRPYQAIPFQWSDHILFADGTLAHRAYLCNENIDPREDFAATLLDALGREGTIFIYTTYETGIIRQLIEHLPAGRRALTETLIRFKDLCEIIRNYYYHPDFYGSFSLKSVLPALLPEMRYETLAIRDGAQASLEYLKMIDLATPPQQRAAIRENLLQYCGHDTLAMVKIRKTLLERCTQTAAEQ